MMSYLKVLVVQLSSTERHELCVRLVEAGVSDILTAASFELGKLVVERTYLHGRHIDMIFLESDNQAAAEDFISFIMGDEAFSKIKIIVVQHQGANTAWAFERGAVRHLNKPLAQTALEKLLRDLTLSGLKTA